MKCTEAHIENLAKEHYGLSVTAKMLNGYDELNYFLTDTNNNRFILKVSDDIQSYPFLDAQVKIIEHLSHSSIASKFQQFCINTKGNELTLIIIDGKKYYLRILSFLEGTFWVDKSNKSASLYSELGSFMGTMDKDLQNFSHTAMHRHYIWDFSRASDAKEKWK